MPQILMEKELKARVHVCRGLGASSEPNSVLDQDKELGLPVKALLTWEPDHEHGYLAKVYVGRQDVNFCLLSSYGCTND